MKKALLCRVMPPLVAIVAHSAFAEEKPVLERIEWSDVWVVDANKNDRPRVLLVGDSIVKGYFAGVEKALAGKAHCARYATSKFMGNPDYLAELEVLLKRYQFAVIHINNGLHGWAYSEKQYEASFPKLLHTLKKHAKGATVIWAATTPVRTGKDLARLSGRTARVKARNRIAVEFVSQHGIPVNDLYALVVGHPEYHAPDGTHFSNEGKAAQAKQVAEVISKNLPHKTKAGGRK